jgi:hypothetical protein
MASIGIYGNIDMFGDSTSKHEELKPASVFIQLDMGRTIDGASRHPLVEFYLQPAAGIVTHFWRSIWVIGCG